jgi:hypothetical protein
LLSLEAASTNFIVFSLTRLALEPMIYHIREEHAHHYTTDAVPHRNVTGFWYDIAEKLLNNHSLTHL